jgi:hypothetical protein
LQAPLVTVDGGAFLVTGSGEITGDTTINVTGSGSFTVDHGAVLQVDGIDTINGALTDNGTIEVVAGTLEIAGPVSGTGSFQIDAGATLELDGAASVNVTFTGSTGQLLLDDPTHFTGTISGISTNTLIGVAGFDSGASVTYDGNTSGGVLTISETGHDTVQLKLAGDFTNSTWNVTSDGEGGILIHDPPIDSGSAMVDSGDGGGMQGFGEPTAGSQDFLLDSNDLQQFDYGLAGARDGPIGHAGELQRVAQQAMDDYWLLRNHDSGFTQNWQATGDAQHIANRPDPLVVHSNASLLIDSNDPLTGDYGGLGLGAYRPLDFFTHT